MNYAEPITTAITVLGFIGTYVVLFARRKAGYDQNISDHFKQIETQMAAHVLADAAVQSSIVAKLDLLISEVYKPAAMGVKLDRLIDELRQSKD